MSIDNATPEEWDAVAIKNRESMHEATWEELEACLREVEVSASDRQVGGAHYDMAIQPIEFIQRNRLGYCEGNVIKYVCRHSKKNGVEDINKAIHYLELLKEFEYND